MVFFKMTFFVSIERDCNLPSEIKFKIGGRGGGQEIDITSFCHLLSFDIDDLVYTHSVVLVSVGQSDWLAI